MKVGGGGAASGEEIDGPVAGVERSGGKSSPLGKGWNDGGAAASSKGVALAGGGALLPRFDSLRPESVQVEEMRRRLVDAESATGELQDIIAEWKAKEKRLLALDEARSEEVKRLNKELIAANKAVSEFSHQNAMYELKLNKQVASGFVDMQGNPPPLATHERENFEAAAGARARRDADLQWEERVAKLRDTHTVAVTKLETEVATYKLKMAEARESASYDKNSALENISMQSVHVKDMASIVGELKAKCIKAEQERDVVKSREMELLSKAQAAIEARSVAEMAKMKAEEEKNEAIAKATIAEAALASSSGHLNELEEQCARLRSEMMEIEKKHSGERMVLKKMQLRESYGGDENLVLKNELERTKENTSEVEREYKKKVAAMTEQIAALKRQLVVSEQEGNERAQQAESARSSADWDRRRAVEKAAALDLARIREAERASRAEIAAQQATEDLVVTKREVTILKEASESESKELRSVLREAKDNIAKVEKSLEKTRSEASKAVLEANFKVEEVRAEVARKVPELAASALMKAEEEWKKRCNAEVEKVMIERDQYINEANSALSNFKTTLDSVRVKETEVQKRLSKLQNEKHALENENRRLDSTLSEMKSSQSRNSNFTATPMFNAPSQSQSSYYPQQSQHQAASSSMFISREEANANATMMALQSQLALMQAQCKVLLSGEGENAPLQRSRLDMRDLSLGNAVVDANDRDEEIERLFESPKPVRKRTSPVTVGGAQQSSTRAGTAGGSSKGRKMPETEDDSPMEADDSFAANNTSMGLSLDISNYTDGGYHGDLWKSRYGGVRSARKMSGGATFR